MQNVHALWLAAFLYHLPPVIALVLSLLSNEPYFSMSRLSIFPISSSNSFRSPLYSSHSPHSVGSALVCNATTAALCDIFLLHPTTGMYFSSCWQVQVLYTKTQFQRFRVVHWAVQKRFHSLRLTPLDISQRSSFFIVATLSLAFILSFTSVFYPPTSLCSRYLLVASCFFPYGVNYAIPPYSSSPYMLW